MDGIDFDAKPRVRRSSGAVPLAIIGGGLALAAMVVTVKQCDEDDEYTGSGGHSAGSGGVYPIIHGSGRTGTGSAGTSRGGFGGSGIIGGG